MSKPTIQPSVRMIETLFRELERGAYEDADYLEYQRLSRVLDDFIDANKTVIRLRRLKDRAYSRHMNRREIRQTKIRNVRRMYLSKGVTPRVLKAIEKLVSDLRQKG